MAKKMIRPIRNEAEYDQALEEIEQYFENEPKPGAPEADRFDLLALVVEDCERKRWPIEPPETIDTRSVTAWKRAAIPGRSWPPARLATAP
jgi:HTH-type transcriptional regulator / antitoxin HigA